MANDEVCVTKFDQNETGTKIFTIIFLLGISIPGFAQTKITAYLELRGTVDIMGNIYLNEVTKSKRPESKIDSLIDYRAIRNIISKSYNPIIVLNALSAEGWTLVFVTQVLPDKDGRPNTPFLLYYLKRDY